MEEKLVIEVDRNNRKIGLMPIADFSNGMRIHRSSHLLLFNSNREVLIHKRSLTHKLYPGFYNYSVSGFVDNETYRQCIKRETQEELGLVLPFKKLFVYRYSNKYDDAFHAVFCSKTDKELKIDKEEIESIAWTNLSSLKGDMKQHEEKYTRPFLAGMEIFFSKYDFIPV